MKNLVLAFMLVLSTLFVSCSNNKVSNEEVVEVATDSIPEMEAVIK